MNKENETKNNKSIYQTLENQIETMLDDIMKEEEEDEEINFRFIDDESSFENESENLLICMPEENENNYLFSNNSQSDIEINNNNFASLRTEKKYPTFSFKGEEILNLNNKSNLSLFFPNNSIINSNNNYNNLRNTQNSICKNNNNLNNKIMSFSTNYNSFNNSDNFSRNMQRKKTFDSNNDEYIFENNINLNMNLNINQNNSMFNGFSNNNNLNPSFNNNNNFNLTKKNFNLHQLNNNNSFFLMNNKQILNNNKINNKEIYNELINKNEMNINKNQLQKKFLTISIPQGTNMYIEMLLYDLNNLLIKNEKIDYFIYNKFKGNFVNLIQTHRGSRMFQNYLKNTSNDIIHLIFTEINKSLIELIKEPYANYFCKKFFIYLNQKDRIDFLLIISSSIINLSINNIGTYPIQAIIEQIESKKEKKIIIDSIKNSIQVLCYDTYGTHVLEKIISCFEEEFTEFIFNYVEKNFLNLSSHINGICIVKKILSLTNKKDIHNRLKKIIIENSIDLIQHTFGNYVLQIIIETWDLKEILEVLSCFYNKFTFLSMLKYSSNVVEKCIEKSEVILKEFINEICNNGKISDIMKNNYGNYVIQKALKISLNEEKKKLVSEVEKNIFKLNDKKLIIKWKSIIYPYLDNKVNNN